ncbi:MAG: PKD domain-containing protein [Thermoplasmata archaeon]
MWSKGIESPLENLREKCCLDAWSLPRPTAVPRGRDHATIIACRRVRSQSPTRRLALFSCVIIVALALTVPLRHVPADATLITGAEPPNEPVINEGESVTFSVTISPGVAVELRWLVDGASQGWSGKSFTYKANFSSAGAHTVTVEATSGAVTDLHSWNLTVINVDLPMCVTGLDPPVDIELGSGSSRSFSVNVSNPDGDPLVFQWFLDGAILLGCNGSELILEPPAGSSGAHTLSVYVSDGASSFEFFWNVSFIAPLLALPEGDVEMLEGESRAFRLEGARGPVSWALDGAILNASGSCFTYSPSYRDSGVHNLSALSNGTLLHSWTVTVINVNQPPIIPDGWLVVGYVGEPVSVRLTARDPDGSIQSYEWDLDGDYTFELRSNSTPNLTCVFHTSGVRPAVLRVTDGEGAFSETIFILEIRERPPWQGWTEVAAAGGAMCILLLIIAIAQRRRIARIREERAKDEFFVQKSPEAEKEPRMPIGPEMVKEGAGGEGGAQRDEKKREGGEPGGDAGPPPSGAREGTGASPPVPEAEEEPELLQVMPSLGAREGELEAEPGHHEVELRPPGEKKGEPSTEPPSAEPGTPEQPAPLRDRVAEAEAEPREAGDLPG